jgi:thioredoxin reductase
MASTEGVPVTLIDTAPPQAAHDRLAGLPVAIIGAGPVGLAAAAHLVEKGLPFVVYEAGESAGSAVALWGHTRLFSPWRYVTDRAARALLTRHGWSEPAPESLPYGRDLVEDYLIPLAATPQLAPHIRYSATVSAVSRQGMDRTRTAGRSAAPFVLRVEQRDGTREELARAVIDTSGTYRRPNGVLASGLDPVDRDALSPHLSHALPDVLGRDRARFAGKRTLVLGAGHSAANTLVALASLAQQEPGTRISWGIRNAGPKRVYTGAGDELQDRAALGDRVASLVEADRIELLDAFEVDGVERSGSGVRVDGRRAGEPVSIEVDVIVGATGFRPDLGMLREIRLALDDVVEAPRALAPLIDPNVHSCGTVPPHGVAELAHPEPGFFLAGMKSYGRAPTFLLLTGYEQVRSIADELAGDHEAARRVQLTLPETGVCSGGEGSACCSTPASVTGTRQPLQLLTIAPARAGGC